MKRKKNELTSREKQVLKYLALDNQNIAELLFVEKSTIRTHESNIYKKLNAKTRTHALYKAVQRGIINIEDIVIWR